MVELKDKETKSKKIDTGEGGKASTALTDSLNFDDILKCDTIPGLLSVRIISNLLMSQIVSICNCFVYRI